jgi:hypothetical protein
MRDGGKKLPAGKPDLLAELAAGLARLDWRELEVWLAIAAAAKGLLRAAALQQQQQQQQWAGDEQWQQQQQQQRDEQQWQQQQQQRQLPFRSDKHWQQQQQQQQQQRDEEQLWEQPPLQQLDWQAQQQQQQHLDRQQQQTLQAPAAAEWLQGSRWYGDAAYSEAETEAEFLDDELWDEVDQEDADEEELYDEDPSYWSMSPQRADDEQWEQQQRQQQQQEDVSQPHSINSSSSSSPAWLSLCYPKLASSLAAVGCEDEELMLLLGDAAVRILPLLSASELADLACAYGQMGIPHQRLLPALSVQLQQCASSSSSSSRVRQRAASASESDVAALVRAAHALGELGFADAKLVEAVQSAVLNSSTSRSMHSTGYLAGDAGSATAAAAAVGPQQQAQLLQLLVLSCCTVSSGSSSSKSVAQKHQASNTKPLVNWVCNAIASSGLEALSPLQMQAAAAALPELKSYPEAAAAAAVVGAAAVARAEECGPEVLVEVLWCCVQLRCSNGVLAETAVAAVERAAETLQQQQQQQQRKKGRKQRPAKLAAATGAAGGDGGMQHAAAVSSKHQAQLVCSLQQMGRPDLLQRVMAALQVNL